MIPTLRRLPAVLLAACLLPPLGAAAPAQSLKSWAARQEGRGVQVSAGLWDLASGKLLEAHQADQSLIPASTTKVVSSYALLKLLKPSFTFETEVWGDLQGGVVRGDLTFKGSGDPSLVSERIWLLAHELKARGVQRVTGRIVLDQSAFDGQRLGDGWGDTSTDTTPPILPFSVNHNRRDGRIVRDPEALAVEVLTQVLQEVGIPVEGRANGAAPPQKLMGFGSPPLRELVAGVNKFSNNFMVEMLVKRLGDGAWKPGIARIQDFYKEVLQLGPDQIRITDGSGLSKRNRLSARTLGTVLRAAWHDFEVGPEFVASLKVIGGEPWALKVQDPNLARRVRCKTGRLDGVHSVCGLLQTPDGKLRVFAIILNGERAQEEDLWTLVSHWAN